jgi:hypothetical protein
MYKRILAANTPEELERVRRAIESKHTEHNHSDLIDITEEYHELDRDRVVFKGRAALTTAKSRSGKK